MQHTQVLVVGGSLVGLSSALFLAASGVNAITIERHAGSSPHPRAIGYTPRTMELLRGVGLGGAIPETPAGFRLRRARVTSLAGEALDESAWTPAAPPGASGMALSPVRGAAMAQDRIEPILRQRALDLGADIRQSVELVSFHQNAEAVTARVRARATGVESTIRTRYLIAADGGESPIREALNITRSGRGHMRSVRSVLFRADLDRYLASGVMQWEIDQPTLKAFLTTYQDGRWVLMFTDDVERDPAALAAAVRQAIGRDDVVVEIITTGRWNLSALVADRFSSGRVFLAGDAAHQLPPTRGGYGANTGIHDAHNLAWKLKAVLSGESSPALLDTYDAERRPVAWSRHQQIFARPDYAKDAQGWAAGEAIIDDDAMEFGQLYRSTGIVGAGQELPEAKRPGEWCGQPGTRAPHIAVEGASGASFLDLLQRGWLLVSGDETWRGTAREAAGQAIDVLIIGKDFIPRAGFDAAGLLGIGAIGASLIRPDGYIAWRCTAMVDAATLATIFAQVASTARLAGDEERNRAAECGDRLRQLEDRAAIAEVTMRYAAAVNQGWTDTKVDSAALADIFAVDATWRSRAMGVTAEGLPAIVAGVEAGTRETDFAMHNYANPVIRIDGDSATAAWLVFIASRRHDGPANMVFLEDLIDYVRTGDGWRIRSLDRRFGMELVENASSHRNG